VEKYIALGEIPTKYQSMSFTLQGNYPSSLSPHSFVFISVMELIL